jgi:anthranilate synthase component 2
MRCFTAKPAQIRHHTFDGLFAGLPNDFTATRYHSLIVAEDDLPDCLQVTARTADGVIMGLEHKSQTVHGVQFHPESIASEHGAQLIGNFLKTGRHRSQSLWAQRCLSLFKPLNGLI